VLTASALALATIAPVAKSADRPAIAGAPPPAAAPGAGQPAGFGPMVGLARFHTAQRVSRSSQRRAMVVRTVMIPVRRAVRRAALQSARRHLQLRRIEARAERLSRTAAHRIDRALRIRADHRARMYVPGARRVRIAGNRMVAVLAFARSQVGKRYVRGGEGANGFDCSGFTKRAYARAGLRLPHSSGGQAARARRISRAQARPGDLVVGAGHVGIYMGRGMMIDAGNRRTGVVYRHLYGGLHIARF
jgi:hypothetical protein